VQHVNKAELVEALAQHYDGSRTEAARALNAVVQTITRSTAAGDKVAITGFGVFEKVDRPARMVRNPRTGERKEAPATSVPRFRPGTELKAYVAGQRELPEPSSAPAAAPPAPRVRRAKAPAAVTPAVQEAVQPTTSAKADVKKSSGKKDAKKDATKGSAKKADAKKSGSKKSGKKKK
jgi:DNA-binding protein HU-beta